jgi:hypothetical protein
MKRAAWVLFVGLVVARTSAVAQPGPDVVDAGPRPVELPDAGAEHGVDGRGLSATKANADSAHRFSTDAGALRTDDRIDDEVDAGVDARILPEGFSLAARVEPDPVDFGRQVELVVTITRPPKRRIDLPEDLEGNDELPRSGPPRREAKELQAATADAGVVAPTRVQETLRFPFLALALEGLRTPAFSLKTAEGDILEVPSLPVRVAPEVLTDPTDGGAPEGALIVESEAPWLMYRVHDDRPWLVLGILLVVAIVVVAARFLARLRPLRVTPGPPPPPPRPAHEVALERLDALMPLLQREEVSRFVEGVMDEVLRDYLAARFALAAGSRTTKEIVGDLLGLSVAGLDVALVEQVGRDADLIKFARATLSKTQAHAMAGRVRALILATAARPSSTADSASAKEA